MQVRTLAELATVLSELDPNEPFPASCMRVPRGKSAGQQKVSLPDGYLDELDDDTPPPAEAEDAGADGG
jgi:hypothetical protein